MNKADKKVTVANSAMGLSSALAIGTAHFVALLYARDRMDGPERAVYTGLAIVQGLGLFALTLGQGAAIFVLKSEQNTPSVEDLVASLDRTARLR